MRMGRMGMRFIEEGREWRISGLLYSDDLIFCVKPEEDLIKMVGCFIGECRRGLKVNADKIKVIVVNGEEALEREVRMGCDWRLF